MRARLPLPCEYFQRSVRMQASSFSRYSLKIGCARGGGAAALEVGEEALAVMNGEAVDAEEVEDGGGDVDGLGEIV